MPIVAFSSFDDGLAQNQQSRDHFIVNTDLENERLWVPYADGVWFQPCHFNVTSGGFSVVLKGLPRIQNWDSLPCRHGSRIYDARFLAISRT